MRRTLTALAAVAVLLLLFAGCGDDEEAQTFTETTEPTITEEQNDAGEVQPTPEEIDACIERTTQDRGVSQEEARDLCTQGLVEPFEDSDQEEQGIDPGGAEDDGGGSGGSGGAGSGGSGYGGGSSGGVAP